jgi:beta-1,4-mannooligosaccharide/beta-1,4-mannosyl-N-acetylglucosamine phosphorylase
MSTKLVASALPNIPWQDRPAGSSEVLWRYTANPVIPRDALPTSNSPDDTSPTRLGARVG